MNALSRHLATVATSTLLMASGSVYATAPDAMGASSAGDAMLAQASSATMPPSTPAPGATPAPSSATPTMPAPAAPPSTATSPATTVPAPSASPDAGSQDAEARRIFDQLDTNHDGILTLDEFSRATFRAK